MLQLIYAPVAVPPQNHELVLLRCERLHLAKRRWRGVADDGQEFGFELEVPLRHGAVIYVQGTKAYQIDQKEEPLLEVTLDLPPSAAVGVGWAVGNLHLELMSEPERLLTPDEPAARQLFDRIGISYRTVNDRFRPGRFARGQTPAHELGRSHQH